MTGTGKFCNWCREEICIVTIVDSECFARPLRNSKCKKYRTGKILSCNSGLAHSQAEALQAFPQKLRVFKEAPKQ